MLDLVALIYDQVPVVLLHHVLDFGGLVTGHDGEAIPLTADDLVLGEGHL